LRTQVHSGEKSNMIRAAFIDGSHTFNVIFVLKKLLTKDKFFYVDKKN